MVDILSTVYPMEAINQLRLGGAANFYRRNYGNILHKLGYWSLHLWWNAAHFLAVCFWNRTANRETNRKHRNRTVFRTNHPVPGKSGKRKRNEPTPIRLLVELHPKTCRNWESMGNSQPTIWWVGTIWRLIKSSNARGNMLGKIEKRWENMGKA